MSKEDLFKLSPRDIVGRAVSHSAYIEDITGQPLIPQSVTDPSILGTMSQDQAKQRFGTKRYEIFVETIRNELAGRDISEEKQWDIYKWLKILNGLDQYLANHRDSEENQVLYPKQMEVFEALTQFLQNGGTEGYFKLPTAFGKTVIFTELIKAANLKTLIVVPTLEVLDQTENTFVKLAPKTEIGKVYGYEKDFSGQITVTTYDSLVRLVYPKKEDAEALDFLPEDIELLILDEAHNALGEKTALAVSQFTNAIKFGFTATPVYSERRHVGNLLNTQVFCMSIKEAAEESLLCPFKAWLAMTHTDLSKVEIDISTGDYNQAQLARVVNTTSRNQGAVDLYKRYFGDESAIVYCVTIRHAQEVARLFRANGIRAEAIWGQLDRRKRIALVNAFKNGEISVLCNMHVLTEGFDAPNASVCINLRPTLSAVVAEQRGGRVLRLDSTNPNKDATIVDFIDKERLDRQQVTFAEVAETAGVPGKLEGQIRTHLIFNASRTRRSASELEAQSPAIKGLEVIVDVIEIMRIASEARTAREQLSLIPEGFSIFHYNDVLNQYPIKYSLLEAILARLNKDYPQHFIRKPGRSPLITEKGLALLKTELDQEASPEGFAPIKPEELASDYGIAAATCSRYAKALSMIYPQHFLLRRRFSSLATPDGLRLLNGALKKFKLPEGFFGVVMVKLSRQYNMPIGRAQKTVRRLVTTHPQDIQHRGGGNANLFATERGLDLLRSAFSEWQENQRTFKPIDAKQIAQNVGGNISRWTVLGVLYKIAPQHPNHFGKYGPTGGYTASSEGMELLLAKLKLTAPERKKILT